MSSVHEASPALYKPGDLVRIAQRWPEEEGPCHIRTPAYVRGCIGSISRHVGAFPNPEKLAFRRPAENRHLYHVAIRFDEIWESEAPRNETLLVEIYEHWIERVA